MEIEKIGDTMKNILSKAGEGYKTAVYKLGGIKKLNETVKNNENYLIIEYLNAGGLLKDFGKKLIYGSDFNNSITKSIIICDKSGTERYYINSKNIKSTEKSSKDKFEVYFKNEIIGFIEVEKKIEGIFSKKEKCSASIFVENEKIAEFVKYDNSDDIEEYSDSWSIDITKVIGGFDLRYKKKSEGLFKKSNILKWRYVQEEKIDEYLVESVIILDNIDNEILELLLMLAIDRANIPKKDKDD